MAALMIPGSKLSDLWGRRTCFIAGLAVYGVGALLASVSPGLGLMIVGNSFLEGIGSALMIPPVYILVTVTFAEVRTRAKYFGVVSGAGALGAATGPLIGGLITSLLGWRALFLMQALVVAVTIFLARNLTDQPRQRPRPPFDLGGAILSAAGLFFLVLGILQTNTYGWFVARKDFSIAGTVLISKGGMSPVWLCIGAGTIILACFFWYLRAREKKGKEPLLPRRLLRDRRANLGLGVQLIQWLTMQGTFFVVSVFLQQVWKYDAIRTGLMLTPASVGILASSAAAERLAGRHSQRSLIRAGFVVTTVGMALFLALVRTTSGFLSLVPGLLLAGLGIGIMLTAAVNLVQSSFPDSDQSDISGLSRSISNLGSSLGTALAGSILVAATHPGGRPFALSLTTLLVLTVAGLIVSLFIPRRAGPDPGPSASETPRRP